MSLMVRILSSLAVGFIAICVCGSGALAQGSGVAILRASDIAIEPSGSFVVADPISEAVIRVDATTGDRSIVSNSARGTGRRLFDPTAIAVEASGDLVVADGSKIVRVDSATGDRTVVSEKLDPFFGLPETGSGPEFFVSGGIAVEASGDLVLMASLGFEEALIRVNPTTGDRVRITPGDFGIADAIAVEASGDLLVASVLSLLRVDPVTGTSTVVADDMVGSGPLLFYVGRLGVEASGSIVHPFFSAVYRIDASTGDRTVVSDSGTGTGPDLDSALAIAVESTGDLVVGDSGAILRIDLASGDRTVVSASWGCPAAPPSGCLTPSKSILKLKQKSLDGEKDSFLWKYIKGPAQEQSDFGDPTLDATYALCLYAGSSAALVKEMIVPPSGTCDGKDCWKPLSTKGYKFKDQSAEHAGAFLIQLKGDPTDAKTKLLMKGKGPELDYSSATLPLPSDGPISVRVLNSSNATCWGADFSSALKNDDAQVKAKFP